MNPIRSLKIWFLVKLLRRAAWSLKQKESYSYSTLTGDFDNSHRLAEFISAAADQIEKGDFRSGNKLWDIFAPTCEWDDANGAEKLGNWIFALLDPQFRPSRTAN